MFTYVVILAGGSGTRLWPASTTARPKQFMAVQDGFSFFRKTLDRALALRPERGVLVVTGASQAEAVVRECRALPSDHPGRSGIRILPEPTGRNTAPAVAFALAAAEGPEDATLLLMPSDHRIEPLQAFRADAEKAETLAADGNLVCFGIPPRFAATGYGYIEAGEALGPGRRAASFREKPDKPTAEGFLAAGTFFWNSGLYAFRADRMRSELADYAPKIAQAFASLQAAPQWSDAGGIRSVQRWDGLDEAYAQTPSISLDFAVSEKSRSVALVETSFAWDDVGSWDEMARLFPEGDGEVFEVEARDCYVYSDIPVALCGVSDIAVVIRNGSALVLRRGSSQLVKDAVNAVREAGRSDLL